MKILKNIKHPATALFALVASAFFPMAVLSADITWTGAANDGGNVLTDGNWDGGTAPTSTDTAIIGDAPDAILSSGTATWKALTIGSVENKTGTLKVTGDGVLNLTPDGTGNNGFAAITMGSKNKASGVLEIDGGTVNAYSLNTPNYSAANIVNMKSGTLNITKWVDWGRNANGSATFNQTGGSITIGGNLYIGRDNSGNGVFNQSGGTLKQTGGSFSLGYAGSANGTYILGENATLDLSESGDVLIGKGSSCVGRFTQYGTVNAPGKIIVVGSSSDKVKGYYTHESGVLNAKQLILANQHNSAAGTYTMNGGVLSLTERLYLGGNATNKAGGSGTFIQNGGEVCALTGVLCAVGNSDNTSATMELSGGTMHTPYINGYAGASSIAFNGVSLVVTNANTSAFISKIGKMTYGAGGLSLDTAGHDVIVSNGTLTVSRSGSSVVKEGYGKVTFDYLPPVDTVKVNAGTVALAADASTSPVPPMLAHRWSFTSDYTDSVAGGAATQIGSAVALSDGKVTLSGSGHGAGSLNLGTNLLDTAAGTIEIWGRHDAVKNWSRVFDYGHATTRYFMMSWSYGTDGSKNRAGARSAPASGSGHTEVVVDSNVKYELATEYHIAVTFKKNGSTTVICWQRRDAKTGELLDFGSLTTAASIDAFADPSLYLGYSQHSSDYDANATYDEVRVWNCILSDDALAKSVEYGPDATTAQLATLTGTSLEVAEGAAFDLGGNSLSVPVLAPGGTLQNGGLTVTKRLKLTTGQTMTVASGATLDLTGVTDISLTNPEDLPPGGWTFATSPSGGITAAEEIPLSGDLAGYCLYLNGKTAKIGRQGLIIIFR